MAAPALPLPADLVPANVNAAKPRYSGAGATADWAGGVTVGDDPGLPVGAPGALVFRSANVAITDADGSANTPDYAPRNQNQKRLMMVPPPAGVLDVGRRRGAIAPDQRYPLAGDAAVPAPVVTSLAPNTAVHGAQPLSCVITGTGFTPYSQVITGGTGSPWDASCQYLSPTQMTIIIDPRASSAGTVSVAVLDHSVMSNTNVLFTIT